MLDGGGLGELTMSSKKVVASPSRLSRESKELVLAINAVRIPGEETRDGDCDASGEDGLDRSNSAKDASVLRATGALVEGVASREGVGAIALGAALVATGEFGLDGTEDLGTSWLLAGMFGFGLMLIETIRSTMMSSVGQGEQEEEGAQMVDIVDMSFYEKSGGRVYVS